MERTVACGQLNRENSITAAGILRELGAIAFARATDILAVKDGVLVVSDTADLPETLQCAIASVEKSTGGIKVKFYDKLKALELLGKAVGLFDGAAAEQEDNGLLEAILAATEKPMQNGQLKIDNASAHGQKRCHSEEAFADEESSYRMGAVQDHKCEDPSATGYALRSG